VLINVILWFSYNKKVSY